MASRYPCTPPDHAALWASLALTTVQLAALCGLTLRQVRLWTARGYLTRSTRDPGRYSGPAVDLALLIKQGLDQGLPLRQAVDRARAYLAAERSRQPDLHALDAAALVTLATRVAQAHAAARDVLAVAAPLAPPSEAEPSCARLAPRCGPYRSQAGPCGG